MLKSNQVGPKYSENGRNWVQNCQSLSLTILFKMENSNEKIENKSFKMAQQFRLRCAENV